MPNITTAEFHAYNARRRKPQIVDPSHGVDLEIPLHGEIENELNRRRIYYIHNRTDKRPTNQIGATDFTIAMPGGKTLWMEVKKRNGKLTKEQNITRHVLLSAGHWHEVVYSFEDFLRLL